MLSVDVLLLDDLGSQRMTDWMGDTVFHIINVRYNNKKPVLVTQTSAWNRTKPLLWRRCRIDLAIALFSRLYEMCVPIEFDGSDYRKEVRKPGMVPLPKEIPATDLAP